MNPTLYPEDYTLNRYRPIRRKTRVVRVGDVPVGGDHPIVIQSMTTTNTMDTKGTVEQTLRLVEAGCQIVRITAPSNKDAQNLESIKNELIRRGCNVPLVADIHFTPKAAMIAADFVEKVRINPGNYADKKKFAVREYTDAEYDAELARIEDKFTPLVEKCKRLGRAMRIGTNHGSLSDRIMNRYGDTPLGMVESALEFVRICIKNDYHDLILSMKSSNPQVMIQAYRLLAARMRAENMDYPFHLGVTEAGDGMDGRIKSAVGIGSLLEDGIGDTIRVSLTEEPEFEIQPAREIAAKYNQLMAQTNRQTAPPPIEVQQTPGTWQFNPYQYERRPTVGVSTGKFTLGGEQLVRVYSPLISLDDLKAAKRQIREITGVTGLNVIGQSSGTEGAPHADILRLDVTRENVDQLPKLVDWLHEEGIDLPLSAKTTHFDDWTHIIPEVAELYHVVYDTEAIEAALLGMQADFEDYHTALHLAFPFVEGRDLRLLLDQIQVLHAFCREYGLPHVVSIYPEDGTQPFDYQVGNYRALAQLPLDAPLVLCFRHRNTNLEPVSQAATEFGSLLCDGIGDAIMMECDTWSAKTYTQVAFTILQAARVRISKTEFISCPSCGRTLFDLQETTARIKSQTSHLKGVKIAIMGCIVNGPGEMADADFGYVGSGVGKIDLYVGKEKVKTNIPTEQADQALIDLIKAHGMWQDP